MKITTEQFTEVLSRSTLSQDEQNTLLSVLPTLTEKQVDDIFKVLIKDVVGFEKILKDHEKRLDKIVLKASIALNKK